MPPEEADGWLATLAHSDLDAIMLAAPTSSDERLDRIVASATGFVYAVSRTGVTGERAEISKEASELTKRVRARSDRPVALGFGISSPSRSKGRRESPTASSSAARSCDFSRRSPMGCGHNGEAAARRGMSEPASGRVIEDWRARIDAIDEQLMRLLNSRSPARSSSAGSSGRSACPSTLRNAKRRYSRGSSARTPARSTRWPSGACSSA